MTTPQELAEIEAERNAIAAAQTAAREGEQRREKVRRDAARARCIRVPRAVGGDLFIEPDGNGCTITCGEPASLPGYAEDERLSLYRDDLVALAKALLALAAPKSPLTEQGPDSVVVET